MATQRLVIYPKDIMLITGKSERYCRYLIKRIRRHFNKEDHQLITVRELSQYLGLDPDEVTKSIV